MRIFVAGNMGYVGPVVLAHLRKIFPESQLHGFDNGYFASCLTDGSGFPERVVDVQHIGDIRDFDPAILQGVDAVVQLAAVSNDPMGNQFEQATLSINRDASISLARAAAEAGVRSFVFASSCSVYGIAKGPPRTETDEVAPETAYARSKVEAEEALRELNTDMVVTVLRFATACGTSPRLRLDLVLNDFVAGALMEGKVTVLSDGSPWRPLIDVADMARAIEWAISRDASQGGRFLIVNTGANEHNYQVRDIAEAVASALPGIELSINSEAPVDSRSYRVDFSLFERLAPDHAANVDLQQSIKELVSTIECARLPEDRPRASELIRLKVLQRHIDSARVTPNLEWVG